MILSVVIVTKDRHEIINECLQSLVEQETPPDEIIIIDGSKNREATLQAVEKWQGSNDECPRLYYEHTEPGICRQRNLGVAASRGDAVLFVDDDAVLDRDFIKNLKAAYIENPDVDGIGGLVTSITFSRLSTFFNRIFFRSLFKEKLMEITFNPPRDGDGRLISVNRIHGCAMSFRKKVFEEFLFDEELPYCGYGSDDLGFCGRVAQKYIMAVAPSCKCVHHTHPSGRISVIKRVEGLLIGYYYVLARKPSKKVAHFISLAWLNFGYLLYFIYRGLKYKDIYFLLLYPYIHAKVVRNGIKVLSQHY